MIRKFTALLLSATVVVAAPAWAQEKITRLVVAFPPGGPVDFVARTIAEQLGKHLAPLRHRQAGELHDEPSAELFNRQSR